MSRTGSKLKNHLLLKDVEGQVK